MKRRKFIQYSALGGAGFIVNLGVYNPQPVNAILPFLFRLAAGAAVDGAFGLLLRGAFAGARLITSQRSQAWFDQRLEAQLAQSKFLEQSFTNVAAAEVSSSQYTVVLSGQRRENLGYNVAFGFPQLADDQLTMASFAGPAAIGMGVAAEYLRQHERMSLQEVQNAILPRVQDYSDWTSWSQPTSYTAYSNIASQDGVLIEYRIVRAGRGGYGTIDITVNASRRIDIPTIKVQFT